MADTTLAFINDEFIINNLGDNIRVNTTNKTVEIFDEFGVKLVLRNLEDRIYEAFKLRFQNF